MRYLHTMLRVENLNKSLEFFTSGLGLVETRRYDNEQGRFTLVFLAAPNDVDLAQEKKAPLLELTYNWPDANGRVETLAGGRNFGHLAYEVEDIYQFCIRLERQGIPLLRPPRDGRMAFIKSPDGISIEILQKGEALPLMEPWRSMANQGSW